MIYRKDTLGNAGTRAGSARVKFLVAWALLLLAKLVLASRLPAFGDEAFYAWEGRRLAWAYSDLPGLTAWLARLGIEIAGPGTLGLRLPFLLIGALLPWWVVRIAGRAFGAEAGWRAGLLALLLPLSGAMGLLALPDVPMLLGTLMCLDAAASLMRRRSAGAALELALGLAIGALAHYRFAPVIAAGAAGLLLSPAGRTLLRWPGLWLALAAGAAAWWPLLAWNLAQAGAGLGFQFVDRHPWSPQWRGLWWLPVQALLVTPVLMLLLSGVLVAAWRRRRDRQRPEWALLAGFAWVAVPGYCLLGFFADADRVSFHWPLPGWIALCVGAPALLSSWPRPARQLLWASTGAGMIALLAYLALLSEPVGRRWLAAGPAYADNFSGWPDVASDVRADLGAMPPGTTLVADNFMLGAQLALALSRDDVRVLEHPLNAKHGRARQLAIWGLHGPGERAVGRPVLLVVEDGAVPLKARLDHYRRLCATYGALPAPDETFVDHGRKRFLRFRLPAERAPGCIAPPLAWVDAPAAGGELRPGGEVQGWALQLGGGIRRVEVTLDGRVVATANVDRTMPGVADFWALDGQTETPLGFSARLPAALPEGEAWLGLVLHRYDGGVSRWPEQRVRVVSGQGEAGAPQGR